LALSRDADELVRRGTAEALQDLASNSEIRERLLQLTYDDDPFVAARAVSALQGALENIEVRSRLLALTRRGDSTVRTSAVAVLRALANTPEVQQLLLELMKESKESELSGMYSADLDEAAVEALRGCTPPFTLALIQPLARLVSYDREGAFETLDTMLAGISASPWTGRLKVNDV
jgi:HEAT repeat protein